MYIHLDQENGRQRFESKLEVLRVRSFQSLDLELERLTQRVPPERSRRLSPDSRTIDFYAASGTKVPVNDRYLLVYTLQPGAEQLDNKQVIGDRTHAYEKTEYFEWLIYAILANGLRKIHQTVTEKGATARIKLPGETTHKPVDEGLISDLYDPRAIEEMRKILGEKAKKLKDEDILPVISISMKQVS